jgi:hypothetical protein
MQVHLSAKWQMAGMQAKQTRGYGDCDMLLARFALKGAWQYAGAQAKIPCRWPQYKWHTMHAKQHNHAGNMVPSRLHVLHTLVLTYTTVCSPKTCM